MFGFDKAIPPQGVLSIGNHPTDHITTIVDLGDVANL